MRSVSGHVPATGLGAATQCPGIPRGSLPQGWASHGEPLSAGAECLHLRCRGILRGVLVGGSPARILCSPFAIAWKTGGSVSSGDPVAQSLSRRRHGTLSPARSTPAQLACGTPVRHLPLFPRSAAFIVATEAGIPEPRELRLLGRRVCALENFVNRGSENEAAKSILSLPRRRCFCLAKASALGDSLSQSEPIVRRLEIAPIPLTRLRAHCFPTVSRTQASVVSATRKLLL